MELSQVLAEATQMAEDDHHVVATVRSMGKEANCAACDDVALAKMARLELTLEKLFKERNLAALAVSCANDAQERYGVAFCYALSRLTAEGLLAVCEADVYGALTMLVQYEAALKATVPHFVSWTIQHQEQRNVFLAWNCGNAPACLAVDPKAVVLREQATMSATVGADKAQGAVEFQLKPGVVTLCRLVEFGGQFKMLITTGEIIPTEDNLRGAWGWVKVPDLERLYRVLAEQGFPPQASLIHGDIADAVQAFCGFAGIEVVRV
jgi:L-fucose isomerase-like protein